jgi:hypothetical protein
MCRSAQKGIYLKELIAEVRAGWAKRKVGRTPTPAKPAPSPSWVFTIFRKAYPFFPVPPLSASGQKRK